ncbi:hypothetical protein FRC0448_00610 [Corynebacterium diphtheriae]|nr:hypothetical protein FRC0448_00610 [Corynebacterium diphtheriae]
MTDPLIILRTAEDVDKAPTGTILCSPKAPNKMLNKVLVVGINLRETLVKNLPLRVLRWGQFRYPTGFDDARLPTLADMTVEEREKCVLMQAQDAGGKLCTILYASPSGASVLYRGGANESWGLDSVTPRPDLPRLEWPSCEPEPEYKIGKTLETFEDFQNTPVGTVAIDADGDLMRKKGQGSWAITDELAVVNTDEVHRWYTPPAKIIAVVEETK